MVSVKRTVENLGHTVATGGKAAAQWTGAKVNASLNKNTLNGVMYGASLGVPGMVAGAVLANTKPGQAVLNSRALNNRYVQGGLMFMGATAFLKQGAGQIALAHFGRSASAKAIVQSGATGLGVNLFRSYVGAEFLRGAVDTMRGRTAPGFLLSDGAAKLAETLGGQKAAAYTRTAANIALPLIAGGVGLRLDRQVRAEVGLTGHSSVVSWRDLKTLVQENSSSIGGGKGYLPSQGNLRLAFVDEALPASSHSAPLKTAGELKGALAEGPQNPLDVKMAIFGGRKGGGRGEDPIPGYGRRRTDSPKGPSRREIAEFNDFNKSGKRRGFPQDRVVAFKGEKQQVEAIADAGQRLTAAQALLKQAKNDAALANDFISAHTFSIKDTRNKLERMRIEINNAKILLKGKSGKEARQLQEDIDQMTSDIRQMERDFDFSEDALPRAKETYKHALRNVNEAEELVRAAKRGR